MRLYARTDIVVLRDGASRFRPAGNIVPFLRPEGGRGPLIGGIAHDARPAPARAERFPQAKVAAFLAVSLALHAGVYAAFRGEAPPLASVGVQSISVEIVLGGDRVAGVAEKPIEAESTVNAAASQGEVPDLVKPETARPEVNVAEAVTLVEAAQETRQAEEAKPVQRQEVREAPAVAVAPPMPEVTTSPPQATVAELQAPPQLTEPVRPTETPPHVQAVREPPKSAAKRPETQAVTAPPRRRAAVAKRQKNDTGEDTRTRESRNSTASVAASGIGVGRSDADTNYRGLVHARLVRNLYFPPEAKRNGERGRAMVSFVIEPSGTVSNIRLAQGTGIASLDSEAHAVVRRSSPFPPPPSGRRELFRAPLTFTIQ